MRIKIKGSVYELPTELTFGEQADIQREFGDLNTGSVGLGTIWIAVRRVHSKTTIEDLRDAVVEIVDEDEDALPPTSVTENEAGGASVPATELGSIGIQRSAS